MNRKRLSESYNGDHGHYHECTMILRCTRHLKQQNERLLSRNSNRPKQTHRSAREAGQSLRGAGRAMSACHARVPVAVGEKMERQVQSTDMG